MKGQPRRDWTLARAKCEEQGCRGWLEQPWGCDGPVEAAHIIGRDRDKDAGYKVLPSRVVPLCREHHRRFDAHDLDIWEALNLVEQGQAVEDAGGFWLAIKRTAPNTYREFNERQAA